MVIHINSEQASVFKRYFELPEFAEEERGTRMVDRTGFVSSMASQ